LKVLFRQGNPVESNR